MELDLIHDIQSTYRKVLNSMARPGIIENIKDEADKVNVDIDCYKSTFLIMLMLLDGETSFKVISNDSSKIEDLVSQITYARVKPIEEADYIFVTSDSTDEFLQGTYKQSKVGNLVDPDKSATIIAEFESFTGANILELTGPGIKVANHISISGNHKWINERANKNIEYPLGVDAIYVDKNSKVLCLPRTTKIREIEV